MSGAEERASHKEGPAFNAFFNRLLLDGTKSCWERDVVRATKEQIWNAWKVHTELPVYRAQESS
jgi:hypothetical protein